MLEAIYHPSYVPDKNWFKIQLLLWDKIYRIVPYSVENNFGSARIADLWNIPEEHVPIISDTIPNHKYLNDRKTVITNQLREISKNRIASFKDVEHFYLNTAKVPDWVGEKLKEFGLRSEETYDEWNAEHYLVREDASDFIMSCVAHYLGLSGGMSPLTNSELSYFATFGNQIGKLGEDKPSGENFNSFISGIFNIMIPKDIEKLDFSDVLDIRTEYSELREGARKVIQSIADEFKLNEIINEKRAKKAIIFSLDDFNKKISKFKKAKWRRAFKDWKVQSIATLLGTVAGFIAGGPTAAIAFSAGGAGISIMNQVAGKEEPSDISKLAQYFNQINRKINMKGINKELLLYRKSIHSYYI